MNKTKSTGPKIDPWGTPCFTVSCSDLTFPKVINCFLSDRYDLNQVTEEGRTSYIDKFFRRSSWSITSKALRKSMNTKPVNSSLSIFVNIWSVSLIRAVSVETRMLQNKIGQSRFLGRRKKSRGRAVCTYEKKKQQQQRPAPATQAFCSRATQIIASQGYSLPIRPYLGRLRPKRVPLSSFKYMRRQGFHDLKYMKG